MVARVRRHALSRRVILASPLLATIVFMPGAATASASNKGAFLKGKTVHFYVGFSPGGGYDLYARTLAPHFERLTGATVVVENRTGGGGLTALNQLVRNKPDGLSMMMLNGESAVLSQLTHQPGVAFDMTKVSIFGRVAHEQHLFLVRPGFAEDLKKLAASGDKIKFSAIGRIDNAGDYAAITCEALKLNCQIITGYKGSKEAALAVMNGEVDALTVSDGSAVEYSQGGRTRVLACIGRERSKLRPEIPTVYEMFQLAPDRKWWLDFRLAIKDFGRVIVAPPGMPPDKLEYLRGVWREILTHPEVIAEGEKTQRPIAYESPAKLTEIVRNTLRSLPPERLRDVNEVLFKKFL
ncbi:MAG TPA: tripartite tricarboxylate transporter substrate-binding protein [Myxococcaceae bacterium]|nr:tripartite tricarboxylate transporter substrate-binding protein [Myxococcaceae bacterium]